MRKNASTSYATSPRRPASATRSAIRSPTPSNNVHGFLSVLEAVRQTPVRHLVYASSSSVYGLDRHVPFTESSAADHPVSLYAATKRANELMAHSYSHLFGIPSTGLRFFTVYGPWGRPDMALFSFTRAILNGDPIDLYNHGDMERDFTYIDDVVEAVRPRNRPSAPGRRRLGRPPVRRLPRPRPRLQRRQRRPRLRARPGNRPRARFGQESRNPRSPHPTRRRPPHLGRLHRATRGSRLYGAHFSPQRRRAICSLVPSQSVSDSQRILIAISLLSIRLPRELKGISRAPLLRSTAIVDFMLDCLHEGLS